MPPRLPVAYIPHGGGPWPFVDIGFSPAERDPLATYLRGLADLPAVPPRAILMVSAHWEAAVPTVSSATAPPMLYDYYGFPPASYEVTWSAPGDPTLARQIRERLHAASLPTDEDPQRGFDHGTFVPLSLAYPEADVPTVQLSLVAGLDPQVHLAMGRALAPLRDEGVFVIGSGMSFHDMRGFGNPHAVPAARAFDAWLQDTIALEPDRRDAELAQWQRAPAARQAHPREEHLMPLMVVAGAAGQDRGQIGFSGPILGCACSGIHFG